MSPFRGALAQLVEHRAFNLMVDGSNPSRPTIFLSRINLLKFEWLQPLTHPQADLAYRCMRLC